MHMKAKTNEYADSLGAILDECPKAVLAAIAVSALTQGGADIGEAAQRLAREWWILHTAEIVPQRPGKAARALLPPNPEDALIA